MVIAKVIRRKIFKYVKDYNRSFMLRFKKISMISNKAICKGHLSIIKFLHENGINHVFKGAIDECSKYGHLALIKYLHENRTEGCSKKAMDRSIKRGYFELVQYLHSNRSEGYNSKSFFKCKDLRIAMFLYSNGLEVQANKIDIAVHSGDISYVKAVVENFSDQCSSYSLLYAIDNNHLEIAKYLLENRPECYFSVAMKHAASTGDQELIKLLHFHPNSSGPTANEVDFATTIPNNLEIVEFLLNNRPSGCTSRSINNASLNGDLSIVKLLHQLGKECTFKAIDNAAINGHFEIVRFLNENRTEGCSPNILDQVAEHHFDIFKYLHYNRNGLGCTSATLESFAGYRNSDALEWFMDNRTERFPAFIPFLAFRNNRLSNVKWLHEHGFLEFTDFTAIYAAMHGALDILKYLLDQGAPCSFNVMDKAAEIRSLEIVEYLHFNRTEGCSKMSMKLAVKNNDLPIFKFLLKNTTERPVGDYENTIFYRYHQRYDYIKKHNL
ncbi:hypothetical protein PPL_08758 [Heterostelium album PN500]|uniref:Ankyrin repeat protein n=1 Tax=Heterostelium pallidum (strain ATCC 26659 / Pp 5 / PN500) TaxID=670386 RepID=D3BJN0_HETP5|nr:hypothetical protein PPL_08758 [Heterostelium album PN500]EFA78110.1 hypothetical protein PPL_08758 [Heterostelium album PN500]|eukprot:XP_020430236.1 hypothetical protein PPL_08758 [Heterostelium album PN500]